MALYLIDLPFAKIGLPLAAKDNDAKIVLIQDGVFINKSLIPGNAKVYAVKNDVEKRGVQSRLGDGVEVVDYDKLVDIILEDKVVNFA